MLVILVAHYAEAIAFLEHYSMELDELSSSKSRYVGDKISLLITGEGKDNVQHTLAKEFRINKTDNEIFWLNFGVAGSCQHAILEILEVVKLEEGQLTEFPQVHKLKSRGLAATTSCRSFLTPQDEYPVKGVVDMEAYYIAEALRSAGFLENLSVIKLVVDGPSYPMAQLSVKRLKGYLAKARRNLTEISDKLIF